jgi:hypothetical protein
VFRKKADRLGELFIFKKQEPKLLNMEKPKSESDK